MNGCAVMKEESILRPQFVQADFFLIRIRELEAKYNKNWGEFFAEYASGKLEAERDKPDYVEWAFLCRSFWSELIAQESPPIEPFEINQKPESDSGFFVFLFAGA